MMGARVLLLVALSGCEILLGIDEPRDLALERIDLRIGNQFVPLTPAFDPSITSYTATALPTEQIKVTAVSGDGETELNIGTMMIRGSALTADVGVRPGSTQVINVRASLDSGFAVNYAVTVTVEGADFGTPIPTALPMNEFMAGGNFDADGLADLVILQPGEAKVILGKADGTFNLAPPPILLTNLFCNEVASGDIDHDGKDDVAAACSDQVAVLNGLGNGQLGLPVKTPLGATGFFAIAVGDLTDDMRADVAVMGSAGILKTLVSVNSGPLGSLAEAPPIGGDFVSPRKLAIGQLDTTARNDVVVVHGEGMAVYQNAGLGDAPRRHQLPNTEGMIALGDFDNTGGLDFAVNDDGPIPRLAIVTGFFPRPTNNVFDLANAPHPLGVAVADLDDDGRDDIVISTDVGLDIFFNTSSGFRELSFPAPTFAVARRQIVIADFTGDGRLDVAVGHLMGVNLFPGIKP
jgi:hypothetical protein